jgi:hypothetical protein
VDLVTVRSKEQTELVSGNVYHKKCVSRRGREGKSRTEREDFENKQKYRFLKRRSSYIEAERNAIKILTVRVLTRFNETKTA